MRVIAGEAKGRRLQTLGGKDVRPTSDRVREALFSTLGERVGGARVLDLFAGSGALGIEALSRGASFAVFVENMSGAIEAIQTNLDTTGFSERAKVVLGPVSRYLATGSDEPFDMVLADPPYSEGFPDMMLKLLVMQGHLTPAGVVVVECASRYLPVKPPEGLTVDSERRYGDSSLVYLRLERS
jgi:16S rRNA (guanine966-N2)-methyltransferase